MRARGEELAALESLTAGKPIRDARAEVAKVAEMFEYYAGWCDKLHGEVIPVPTSHLNYTRHEPLGTVVQLTPWNAPLFTAGWQIAPAVCAGNAVVLKPSELTPLSTLALGVLCEQAGMPRGLVSVLAGSGPATGAAAVTPNFFSMSEMSSTTCMMLMLEIASRISSLLTAIVLTPKV